MQTLNQQVSTKFTEGTALVCFLLMRLYTWASSHRAQMLWRLLKDCILMLMDATIAVESATQSRQ